MAKGSNGTIDVEGFKQMHQQRLSIEASNLAFNRKSSLGVGSKLHHIQDIFPKSPLIPSNLSSNNSEQRDPDGVQNAEGDVYKMYASAIDKTDNIQNGFGFEHVSSGTNLNYNDQTAGKENPFVVDGVLNFNALTTGRPADESGNKKRNLGFPDLVPPSLEDPNETSEAKAKLIQGAKNDNFGSTTDEDRQALNIAYAGNDNKGTFDFIDSGTAKAFDKDSLGMYFKKNYTS